MNDGLESCSHAKAVKELQKDLARRYAIHREKIEKYWRSFDQRQRKQCIKAGSNGVLQTPSDTSLGNVYKFIPEWNLRDLTEPGSDFLLKLLEFRALKTVYDQYLEGINDTPGDRDFIRHMMATRNLRHVESFPNEYAFFLDEDQYGMYVELRHDLTPDDFPELRLSRQYGAMIDKSTAELVLMRQMHLLQLLVVAIDDILEKGSSTRTTKAARTPPEKNTPPAGLAQIGQAPAPKETGLFDLVSITCSQRDSANEYLKLLSTEPVVLAHAVNFAFFSRPELVADDKGNSLPAHTDKYISPAFFDAIHTAVQTAAVWNYLGRLLEYLGTLPENKACRTLVLQEIANVCNLEYNRDQAFLKRHVQTGMGIKFFKRFPDSYDNSGNARVALKGDPAKLARGDKQLQTILRLCQADTNASKAADCVKSLAELHEKHPNVRDKLGEGEYNALVDLYRIIHFIQEVTPVISMPPVSRKSGRQFITKTQELEAELSQLKNGIDLLDYALPIDNLLEPGMADGALEALDNYIVEKTGTKLGFLYQDTIDLCLASIEQQCQQEVDKINSTKAVQAKYIPFPEPDIKPEVGVEHRREKQKTRPDRPSVFEIVPPKVKLATVEEQALSPQMLKVSAATADVFSRLFDKSKARGSVPWASFEAALAELKFSVIPKFGSVYTFYPPDTMEASKSFTVHRPHNSQIEGYLIPIFARRLNRLYAWGEKTFVVA